MINRTKDLLAFGIHMRPYMEGLKGLEPDRWLLDDNNIALTTGEDYSLFEWTSPGVYYSHIFATSKKAIQFGKDSIQWMFENGAEVLKGLTPVEKRHAIIAARRMGFKSHGIVDTHNGPHELFILTRKEWETKE